MSTCDGNLGGPVGRAFEHGPFCLFNGVYVGIRVHIESRTSPKKKSGRGDSQEVVAVVRWVDSDTDCYFFGFGLLDFKS